MWLILVLAAVIIYVGAVYKPEWEDLDNRPLPQWYDVAKIGIFVHWGLYAVPAHKSEWFWDSWVNDDQDVLNFAKRHNYRNYEEFADMLTGKLFEPDDWAALFYEAGARYVVLTSKHHDGYALFKSSGPPYWNSVQSGPRKDIVELLAKSVRNYSMKFGIYYSLLDWYIKRHASRNQTASKIKYVENVMIPDIQQLLIEYEPSVLWADGDWDDHSDAWKSRDILAWIYNESPVKDEIVVNDRWGAPARNQHGDFFNGGDRLNPKKLLHHKWENAFSLDRQSWGYRDESEQDIIGIEELIRDIVFTISCGGNVLINVGPTKEGLIMPVFQKRLLQLGVWLQINGEAIYNTSPWYHQNDSLNPHVWYTCKKQKYNPWRTSHVPDDTDTIIAIYAIFLKWPENDLLLLKDLGKYFHNKEYKIFLLAPVENTDNNTALNYDSAKGVLRIRIPRVSYGVLHGAWALKIISGAEEQKS